MNQGMIYTAGGDGRVKVLTKILDPIMTFKWHEDVRILKLSISADDTVIVGTDEDEVSLFFIFLRLIYLIPTKALTNLRKRSVLIV